MRSTVGVMAQHLDPDSGPHHKLQNNHHAVSLRGSRHSLFEKLRSSTSSSVHSSIGISIPNRRSQSNHTIMPIIAAAVTIIAAANPKERAAAPSVESTPSPSTSITDA